MQSSTVMATTRFLSQLLSFRSAMISVWSIMHAGNCFDAILQVSIIFSGVWIDGR